MSDLLEFELGALGLVVIVCVSIRVYNKWFNPVGRTRPESQKPIECLSLNKSFDKEHI